MKSYQGTTEPHSNLKKNVTSGLLLLAGVVLTIIGAFASSYLGSTVLLLVGGMLGLLVLLGKPFQGLLVFSFLLPSEALIGATPGSTLIRYVGFGVALIWLIDLLAKRRPIIFRKRSLWYLSFFALSWLSLLWAPAPELGFQFAVTYLQLALLLIIIVDQVTTLERLKQIIVAMAAGGILAIGAFYVFGDFSQQGGRLGVAAFGGQGLATYGYPLAFSMTLLGVLGILSHGKTRIMGIIGYMAGLYPIIGMGLRGSLLATMAGIGTMTIVVASKRRSVVIVAVLALGLLIGTLNYLSEAGILPFELAEHLTIADAVDTGGNNRLNIWQLVLDVVPQHPIFGLGLNQFSDYVYARSLYGGAVGTHNDYLDALVNLGAVGGTLLVLAELVTVIYLVKAHQYVRRQDIAWYGVLVALIIASIVAQNFVNLVVFKYGWAIRAIVIAGSSPDSWGGETSLAQNAPAAGQIERKKQ